MTIRSLMKHLHNGSSALALSTMILVASSAGQSASAATTIGDGLVGGGSTLASLALRQAYDCYAGVTVGTGAGADGYSFDPAFNAAGPTPGLLPTGCTTNPFQVEGLYAGVGSGAGLRGFVSNRADQLFRGSASSTPGSVSTVFLPAVPPQFIDNNNVNATSFGQYPYGRVDFGASDSPLPSSLASLTTATFSMSPATNWESATSITATANGTTAVYDATKFGQPIQLPLFEAPVAVALNVPANGTSNWTINSQNATITAPGGAIQLSTAQVCAVFSGLVTDWADASTVIPTLNADGSNGTQLFFDDNTFAAGAAGAPGAGATVYVPTPVPPVPGPVAPITVVYRSDGSGTSFIFTNYLKTVCPLLDPADAYKYQSIFNQANLPNNSFANLVSNIASARGVSVTAPGYNVDNNGVGHPWVGASGSDAVAAEISNAVNDPSKTGRIGYLSNDFVAPYNNRANAPASASLQNDSQRASGVNHPGVNGTDFIAPTPASADAAWTSALSAANGVTLLTSWAYDDYNVYKKSFPAGRWLPGTEFNAPPKQKVSIAGLSLLPLANDPNAYPAVGTPHLFVYSCYGDGADGTPANIRKQNLVDFLNWYYTDANGAAVVQNNGFHALPLEWAANISGEYLTGGTPNAISDTLFGADTDGCAGVTGGAN
jgi:phosphate transport system substrate-binding protein